jgi:hypothetical protein
MSNSKPKSDAARNGLATLPETVPPDAPPQSIREFLGSCSIKTLNHRVLEACEKHGISLDSPWPPHFPKEEAQGTGQPSKTAEVIRLCFWGEDYRAAPNAIFRSALFPALHPTQKENRRFLEEEEIFCVAGLKIFFTGKQFDQSDLDVYLEILNMAKNFPLGSPIRFSAHALLKALGLPTGGSNHARLHKVLIRLCGGVVDATDHGKRYFGQLLHGGIRDEITQNYEIRINPDFAVLFGFGMFAKLDLEKRRALGRNNTAKALYGYYASHINPSAHTVETLAKLAGLANSNQRQTKAALIKAHEAMKDTGILSGYTVVGDTIKADIVPTPSQARAILKQAAKSKAGDKRRNRLTHVADLLKD